MFTTALKQKLFLTLIAAVLTSSFFIDTAAYGDIRIMPLGDSITKGYGSSYSNSYRKPLYLSLTAAGYDFDFVGSATNGNFPDPNHEGHGGWHAEKDDTVYDINDQVYGWLTANPADIVLLHIGTNDITYSGQDANEVNDILAEIDRFSTDVTVILALIINRRSDARTSYRQATTQFNQDVNEMAQSRIAAGDDIIIVNMENALDYNVIGGDMLDQLHPRDSGYAKMAQCWYNIFTEHFIEKKILTTSSTTGGSVTTPGEGSYQYNHGTEVNLVATPDLDYYFAGWTGTGASAGKIADPNSATTTIIMDANYTAIANFSQEQLTLTTSSTAGGSVTNPGEGQFQYDYGTEVNLVATVDTDYYFVSWTGTGVNADKVANPASATTTITMNANYTAVANFAANCVKTLYIDGTLIGSSAAPEGLSWPSNRLTIGAEGTAGYLYNEYIGDMDDFAIYDAVLDACNVAAHYTARTNYDTYKTVIGNDNPLLWLKFDDPCLAHDEIAFNSGSIGIDGQYVVTGVESSPITAVTGFHADSHAINFPDTGVEPNGHCVDVWDGNGDFGEDLEGDVTVEFWVNFTDINSMPQNDHPRFFQHNGNWRDPNGYGMMIAAPNIVGVFGGGDTDYMTLPYDINDNNWHHIVVTYESSYKEPNEVNTLSYVEEVAKDEPVVWIRFESTTPEDSAGNDNWVTYGGAATIVEKAGGIGNSILQDTAGDGEGLFAAAVAKDSNVPPYEEYNDAYAIVPSDITVEMWYKTLPAGQPQPHKYGMFFQQIGISGHEPDAPAVGNSDGQIRICAGTDYGYTNVDPKFDGKWHHMVVTYDEQYGGDPCLMVAELYLDGSFRGYTVAPAGAGAKLGTELSHMVFGAENNRGYSYNVIPGYFDEIAIYEGILDPNRVLAHYTAWQPKDCNELWERGGPKQQDSALEVLNLIDTNNDCMINLVDFALFAQQWTLCNDPEIGPPECPANW